MNPIIFLDFDGVLNGHEWCHLGNSTLRINRGPAECLDEIVRRTGAEIVVISTWRVHLINGDVKPSGFEWCLRTHGISAKVIGWLPDGEVERRSEMIQDWLSSNPHGKFVVIDDLPLTVTPLIRPHPGIGLQPHHVSEAIRCLT